MTEGYDAETGFRPRLSIRGRPVVTEALLAVNILLWVALELRGGSTNAEALLDFGAISAPLIADGEYWRLFTGMFLHAGVVHILANGLSLFIFGRIVEGIYGHARFALVYLLAGLFGSVASFSLNSTGVGVGASGAVFGLVGALAAYFVANRRVMGKMGRQNLTGLVVLMGINLAFGLTFPGIDNWAHLGGLASGFLLGLALAPSYRHVIPVGLLQVYRQPPVDRNSLARRWYVAPAAVAVLLAALWAGLAVQPETTAQHLQDAERLIEQQEYDAALSKIADALTIDPMDGEAYLLAGRIYVETGNYGPARDVLGRALRAGLSSESRDEALDMLVSLSGLP